MPPSKARGPEPRTRTFDEAFAELHLTQAERTALVWHLAAIRAQKTIEVLINGNYILDSLAVFD